MTRTIITGVIAGLVLAAAPAAQASWFLSKTAATRYARQTAVEKYKNDGTVASCRPFARNTADPALDYHRWVCGWAGAWTNDDGTELTCSGQFSIAGSRYYAFQWRVLHGERCSS